jgi:hypothetical protein
MKVPAPANRRTRTAIRRFLEIIEPKQGALRQPSLACVLGQNSWYRSVCCRRPSVPKPFWVLIGRVRIIGSSIIRTRFLASSGTPSHASGGETSSPWPAVTLGALLAGGWKRVQGLPGVPEGHCGPLGFFACAVRRKQVSGDLVQQALSDSADSAGAFSAPKRLHLHSRHCSWRPGRLDRPAIPRCRVEADENYWDGRG